MIRSLFILAAGLSWLVGAAALADPQAVRLVAIDTLRAEGPLAFDAFLLPELEPVYADSDEAGVSRLDPGRYMLIARDVPGVSVEIDVADAPVDARVAVDRSVWLTFVTPQPKREGQPEKDYEARALLALRSPGLIREIESFSRAWSLTRAADDVLALPTAGASGEAIGAALTMARELIAKEFAEPSIPTDRWSERYYALLAAARVLTTYGDDHDAKVIHDGLANAKTEHPMRGVLLATLAAIEARTGRLERGLMRDLAGVPALRVPAEFALADLGDPDAERSLAAGDGTTGLPPLGVTTGPYTASALEAARAQLAKAKADKSLRWAFHAGSVAASALVLLSAGNESDLATLASERLSPGLLQRFADASRAPVELARAAAKLHMTYLTYRMAQSARVEGEGRAASTLDGIALGTASEFCRQDGKAEDPTDRTEYLWIMGVASAWTPTDTAVKAIAKGWIMPDKPEAYIHANFPWLAAEGAGAKAAGWFAQGHYGWRDFAEQATPAEFEAAGKQAPPDKLIPSWGMHVAAARVTTRACAPPDDEFPLGVTRVPYVVRADEGCIVGVASLRPSWRDSTLRLAVRLEQRAAYVGGGLIDFHQGDIRSYDHFEAATRPWSALVSSASLRREEHPLSLNQTGLDENGWMTFEADLPARDVSGLWFTLVLKYKDRSRVLTFDLPRSDFARLMRRAEGRSADTAGVALRAHAASLFAVGRTTEALAALGPELAQARPAAVELALAALAASGDQARAADLLERLAADHPDRTGDAAYARYQAGQFDRALALTRAALTGDPTDVRMAWLRARLLVLLGRHAEAAAMLTSPPLAGEDSTEIRVLRYATLARLPQSLKGHDRDDAEEAAKAEARSLKAYVQTLPEDTPERRLWQDVSEAWSSAGADRDATTPHEVCAFSTYRGYGFLAGGRRDLASAMFKAAVDTWCVTLLEYQLAKAELVRLKDTPP